MNLHLPDWSKICLIFGASILMSEPSYAIDSLRVSLEDVMQKALQNSKYIEQAHLNLKREEVLVQQKRTDLLPQLSVRGSASYAANMPIYDKGIFNKPSQHDVIHYLYDTGADFYLNLYNGHRDLMNIKSQKLVGEIANVDWIAATGKIKMDVCNLFLELQLYYSNKALIENDILDQKEQLREVKNLYQAGTILHSDVLRIELELSKRELLLVKIQNDMVATNKQLQLITGIEDFIQPIDHVFDKTLPSFEAMLNVAKKQAFSLQKSVSEVQLKQLAIKQAKSNYLPTLGLTGTYTFANPQIFLYPYNDSWYSLGIVGLKASMPISSFYTNRNVVKASQISYEQEKVKHHDEEDQIENQLLQASLDYKLAVEQKNVCIKNVELAKENVRIIKNRYFKSAALVTDLLDADMQYLQTLFELESASISMQKQYYFIEFIKGTI